MAKDLTAIRIEGELVEALKQISAQDEGVYSERSVNWLIGRAVREFVERHLVKKAKPAKPETGKP
jgi:predicted transcriptional regulator